MEFSLLSILLLLLFCCSFINVLAEDTHLFTKWDLTEYFKDSAAFENEIRRVDTEALPAFEKLIGEFKDDASLLKTLQAGDSLEFAIDRLNNYAYAKKSLNAADTEAIVQKNSAYGLSQKYSIDATILTNRLLAQDDQFWKNALADESLAAYRYELRKIKEDAAHILSENDEKLLLPADQALTNINQTFDVLIYSEMPIGTVKDPDGKDIKTSYSNYVPAMQNPDREYRSRFYNSFASSYKGMRATYASNLNTFMTLSEGMAKVHHFNSLLDQQTHENDLTPEIYRALITGGRNITSLIGRKNQICQKALGYDQLYIYDTRAPIGASRAPSFSFEEARTLVEQSLSVLGQDYAADLDQAFTKKWIDAYPADNKDTGAYSGLSVDLHPWVLLNFMGNYESVSTLAHELGHAIHQYRSDKNQATCFSREPTSLVSEVASTTNELLLSRYMIDHAVNGEEKLYYVQQELSLLESTFFRQIQFADFEMQAHEKIEAGEALTADSLDQIYEEVLGIYSPNLARLDVTSGYWAAVPHFYYDYYVYSYAMDIAIACHVADKISKGDSEMVRNYRAFLEAGNKAASVDLFNSIGVDVTRPDYIHAFADRYSSLLDLEEELLRK